MRKTTLQWVNKSLLALTLTAFVLMTLGIVASTVFAATTPVTDPATGITSTNATLNGTNGDTDATASAFWVSTSTFAVASSSSPSLPANVYSTGDIGAVASSTAFSALLSSATIPAGLLPITPGTTYYFTAWSQVGGVWSPGAVLSFTTVSSPTITDVSPVSGSTSGGTPITITGTGFASGATVTVGGTPATSVVVASSTSITATTPAGSAGAQNVVVTNTDTGSATSAGGFTYVAPAPAPTISSLSPSSGTTAGGTTVTVTGTNLTGTTVVNFGTTPATGVVVSSSTSLTAISPAGTAGVVNVTATTPDGTSATSSADQYTYVSPVAAPVISNVSATSTATTTATVTWDTDVVATGQVFYGTTTAYGSSSVLNAVPSTTHSFGLSGLTEATLYHYQVVSTNAGGTATSSDRVFTAGSTSSSTPLAVSSIDAVDTTATADGTYANGWRYIFNLTLPSNEPNVAMKFSDWLSGANTIAVANNMRISSAQADNAGATITILAANTYTTPDLHMTGDLDSATPGIQVEVLVEVKIPSGTTDGSYTTTYGIRSQ